jgi:MFS family permease
MLFFEPRDRVRSVSATLAGSLAQFTATVLFGLIGAAVYLNTAGHPTLQTGPWIYVIAAPIFALTVYVYFKIQIVSRWIEKRRWHKKISEAFHTLAQYDKEQLFVNLWFSAFRYLVFAIQMALVLYLMVDFSGGFDLIFIAYSVFAYFLVQTAVPSIALSEIGVRGSVLTLLFVHVVGSEQVSSLILAGTLIWFVNIIIPALFGSLFILKTKIK